MKTNERSDTRNGVMSCTTIFFSPSKIACLQDKKKKKKSILIGYLYVVKGNKEEKEENISERVDCDAQAAGILVGQLSPWVFHHLMHCALNSCSPLLQSLPVTAKPQHF